VTTKEDILKQIKMHKPELFRLGISNIGLFGSYLRNEQSSTSDIDILVDFFPDKESFDNYMAVCDIVESLFKDERVEVVTKNGLSPHIGTEILSEVVYA
jgi:hypothetical protein